MLVFLCLRLEHLLSAKEDILYASLNPISNPTRLHWYYSHFAKEETEAEALNTSNISLLQVIEPNFILCSNSYPFQ